MYMCIIKREILNGSHDMMAVAIEGVLLLREGGSNRITAEIDLVCHLLIMNDITCGVCSRAAVYYLPHVPGKGSTF